MPQPRNRRVHWTIPPQPGQMKSSCPGRCECPRVFHHAQRPAPDFQHMASELRPCTQRAHARVRPRRLARHRDLAAPDQPHIRGGLVGGARRGRMKTKAVRPPVRPATECMWVVSSASARVMGGKMLVSRRASTDFPAPGGPISRMLWSERPPPLHARLRLLGS
jgi:hypothetical protein